MRACKSAVALYIALALVTPSGLGQEVAGPNGSGEQSQASADAPDSMQIEAAVLNVVYEDGRLSISAHGCGLKQILDAVREKTGASLQLPAFLNVQRVVVQLGPDDPQRVLGSLLYGAGLNYIVTGSIAEGEKLNVVVELRPQPGTPIQRPAPASAVIAASAAPAESATLNLEEASEVAEKAATDAEPDMEKKKEKEAEVAVEKSADTSQPAVTAADRPADAAQKALEGASSLADRLAELPSNINPAIAALYPSLFSGATGSTDNSSSSSMTSEATSSKPIGTQGLPTAHVTRLPVSSLPVGPNGIPVLPSNIPPEMWKLYPPNLMQLITTNTPPPPTPVLPLAPGLPTPGTPGQPAFWDQAIHH